MQIITPCLWFNNEAEEAANFYTSIFKDASIKSITRYGQSGARVSGIPAGTVMTVAFDIGGQEFIALNGGPAFTFSPAISLLVNCETQEEVDHYWENLSQNGEIEQCGWLKDKYGVSWQIVPVILDKLLGDPDPVRAERVMQAMLGMKKLDIAGLQKAHESTDALS